MSLTPSTPFRPQPMTLAIILLVILAVLLADWPWHSRTALIAGRTLRVALTLGLAFMLYWDAGVGVGRAWRRAMAATDRVTSAPPAFPTFTPYESGVTTMQREASKDVTTLRPFLLALVILGIAPVLRPAMSKYGARAPDAPSSAA